ncbi:MAG: methionyl-tRNA formyltransferase [Clostridiales bacterium]|nr:methionyl-tRNA formyltransferase [Clostridiales bacterium]
MAKIDVKKITKLDKERNTVQEEVAATYTVFEKNGERYFQIDTYGRSDRIETEKASQIIQIDKDSAKELIKLLLNEFKIL